jgi:uncharacterized protein
MAIEWWYLISGAVIVIGLLGTILPALPGVPLVFGGMLLAAWAGDFREIGGWTVAILAVLAAIAWIVDFAASAFGTKVVGASGWAFAGASVGALIGIFFGLPGLLIGPFVGTVAGEWIATSNLRRATSAGAGATLGLVLGAAAKIAICFTMLGVFLVAALWK